MPKEIVLKVTFEFTGHPVLTTADEARVAAMKALATAWAEYTMDTFGGPAAQGLTIENFAVDAQIDIRRPQFPGKDE